MEAALIIVINVIFLVSGSMRTMVIPLVTIPPSLIGSMFFMLSMGFSINLLTLFSDDALCNFFGGC
ncbi:efflux RND transporter permease subunit [Vibrio lentus]|nr:efflux RND transporter permease subunit [Vibrio lentus]